MQFYDYVSCRNRMARSDNLDHREWAKGCKPDEFRLKMANAMLEAIKTTKESELKRSMEEGGNNSPINQIIAVNAEHRWVDLHRPFYNIWPVAYEMASSVKLDLPFTAIEIPSEVLLLRFAKGHDTGLTVAMIYWCKKPDKYGRQEVWVFGFPVGDVDARLGVRFRYSEPETHVEEWLQKLRQEGGGQFQSAAEQLIRLTVFVGLLANDRDVITPIVLAKDREKYDATTDDDVRQAIERRAMRRLGKGFDVGKALQQEKEQTPHWRNPHLAMFWTGKGRLKPIIKMRRGAVVHRVTMAEVPTGYLGPETDKDAELPAERYERIAISTSKRFEIFKRDGYRCQLCGAKADDGAALHVDHRVAVAKGGMSIEDNLWTLCDRCNLGKSDADL